MAYTQPINPRMLDWAMNSAGFRASELGAELSLSAAAVKSWLSGDSQPNQGQLSTLAKALGQLPSFFFLPEPPVSIKDASFRTFKGSERRPGRATLEGMSLARDVQQVARWTRENLGADRVEVPALNRQADPEQQASILLTWLHWDSRHQRSKTESEASIAKLLRRSIEAQGVIVMHLTMDEELTRGFSVHDDVAPLIAVNTRDNYKARIFSYMHELVHLGLGSDSLCEVHRTRSKVERFCNEVASAALMPEEDFRSYVRGRVGARKLSSIDDLKAVRSYFKVSFRAAALRADKLGLATEGLYERVDAEAEPVTKGGTYRPGQERTKPRIRADQFGRAFVGLLGEAIEVNKITPLQAADILRLSSRELNTALEFSSRGDAA